MKNSYKIKAFSIVLSLLLLFSAMYVGISAIAEEMSSKIITDVSYCWDGNIGDNGENNFKGQTVITEYYKDNKLTDTVSNYSDYVAGIWFNSNAKDDATFAKKTGSVADEENGTEQTTSYWKLRFKINGVLNNPKSFIFSFHASSNAFMSKHYAVFASDSYSDIESKKIIEIKSSIGRSADKIDVSGLNLTNIKYVEVRIYHRGMNLSWDKKIDMGQHINEIGFFGGTVEGSSNAVTAHSSLTAQNAQSSITDAGINRLDGQEYETSYYYDNGSFCQNEKAAIDSKWFSGTMVDSSIGAWHNKTQESSCQSYKASNEIFQDESYREININLSEPVSSPEKFIMAFHPTGGMASQHYAVYMSEKKADLYNAANKIIEITDSKASRIGDLVELGDVNLKNIQFVGIRIFNFGYMYGCGCKIQHISQIGLYGGKTGDDSDDGTEHTKLTGIDQITLPSVNQLANKTSSVGFYVNDSLTTEFARVYENFFNGIIDDATIGAWHSNASSCNISTAPNDTEQTSNYWQLQMSLGGTLKNPDKFIIVFHKQENALMSKHYAVFAANSVKDLYNDSSKIIEVKDSSKRLGDEVDLTKLSADLSNIRYIAIRFYHRGYTVGSSGCTMQHIAELGVYGGDYTEDTVDVKLYNSKWQYGDSQLINDINAIGENLIAGKVPYQTKVNGLVVNQKANYQMLTDGLFNKHLDIGAYVGKRDGAFDMIYRLDSDPNAIKTIEKFILRGISADGEAAATWGTGKYEVYAAVSFSNLFSSENMIYSYDYERDGVFICQTAAFKNPIYARYVAVRIIDPITNSNNLGYTYPRISEIAFLGNNADIKDAETELSNHMPIDVYVTDSGNVKTQITDQLTIDMLNRLIDNDPSTDIDFSVNGDKLDIVFNLCKEYDLTKVTVERAGGFNYSIYAAQSFSELWSENAKLSDGNFTGSKKSRYVRISVAGNQGKKLTFKDISIIGYANPLIERYERISYSLGVSNLKAFEKDLNDNNSESIKYLSSGYSNLFDGDTVSESIVTGGVSGKSSLNLLVQLSQLQSIENISLYFPPHLVRYLPTLTRIYISDSYEGIMDFAKSPAVEFNGLPESGMFSLSTVPTLARYIRIEFVSNIYGMEIKDINGEKIDDPFVTEDMRIALSEIAIDGCSVNGMGTDDGILTSFSDSGSGIVWDVISIDEGDIVDDFYTSKLTASKATNAQKASLYKSPYYKVVGDTVYKIEFYDFFGNKVNDIKNREVQIKIPVAKEKLDGISMIANASSDTAMDICQTDESVGEECYVTYKSNYDSGFSFSLLELTDENDAYWQTVDLSKSENTTPPKSNPDSGNVRTDTDIKNTVSSNESETTFIDAEETEPETREVDAGTETKYSISYSSSPVWLIVVAVIQGVLLLAAVAIWLLIQFKRKKPAVN